MMDTEISVALVGILSSVISSVVSWFLAKRKYNAEVDSDEIQNLKDSLDFYKDVLEENQRVLKTYIKKVDDSMLEIHSLRKGVQELLAVSCIDTLCKARKLVGEDDAKKLLRIKDEE